MFEKESQEAEMAPSEITEVKAPKAMTEDEVRNVQIEAEEIVARLEDASGGEGLELLDNIANVGIQAERKAAGQLNLLRSRVGSFLNEGGTSKEIADGLRDLRANLDKINPQELTHQGIRDRVLAALPLLKGRYNPVARTLHKIALRYEPVSRQVAVIETKLSEGQAMLDRDNVELRMLYEDVEAQQLPIQRNAYLGELLIQHLSRLVEQSEDPAKQERVQGALHDVAVRVNDLRTMEEVHIQYFISIEMGRQNNSRLGQSVERTLTLATNVVTIGLAIQSALIRQKRVMEAASRTRGDMFGALGASGSIVRELKQRFDPTGVLNPGRFAGHN